MRAALHGISATKPSFSDCCYSGCRADLWAPGESVQAQANAPPAVAPARRLTLTAEQEYIIREIILKDSDAQKENAAPETVGDVAPDDVKLYPLPQAVIQSATGAIPHVLPQR
jgi:hypothetical protein